MEEQTANLARLPHVAGNCARATTAAKLGSFGGHVRRLRKGAHNKLRKNALKEPYKKSSNFHLLFLAHHEL